MRPQKLHRPCSRCHQPTRSEVMCARCFDRLDDVDDIAVERAMDGELLRLNRGERLEVIRRLRRIGQAIPEIAERLGCSDRRIGRDLAYMRDLVDAECQAA